MFGLIVADKYALTKIGDAFTVRSVILDYVLQAGPSQGLKIRGVVVLGGENVPPPLATACDL